MDSNILDVVLKKIFTSLYVMARTGTYADNSITPVDRALSNISILLKAPFQFFLTYFLCFYLFKGHINLFVTLITIVFSFGIVHFLFEKIIRIDRILINNFHRLSIVSEASELLNRNEDNVKIQTYATAFVVLVWYVFWGMSLLFFMDW